MRKKSYKDILHIDESYFINKINKSSDLEIISMAHNRHWPYIEKRELFYKNSSAQMVGKKAFSLIKKIDDIDNPDCDLLTFYATDYDHDEYMNLKMLGYKISKENNKMVTIGYAYFSANGKYDIKLANIVNGFHSEEIISNIAYLSRMELIAYTLLKHENIVHKKYKERVK